MENLDAEFEMDNIEYEDIIWRHRLGERDENGEGFASLCVFNKMVVGSTIFLHERIQKATWLSLYQATEDQIDHIGLTKNSRDPWKARERRQMSQHQITSRRLPRWNQSYRNTGYREKR